MTITIVCGCGHHNLVFDTELEKARCEFNMENSLVTVCESCNTLLLKPVGSLAETGEAKRKTA